MRLSAMKRRKAARRLRKAEQGGPEMESERLQAWAGRWREDRERMEKIAGSLPAEERRDLARLWIYIH